MRASNQGFIDLHTPLGFFMVGVSFLLLSGLIICGAVYARHISLLEREHRLRLKEELLAKKGENKG